MNNMIRFLAVLAMLLAPCMPAKAFYYTGEVLYRQCSKVDNAQIMMCIGYIVGVVDTFELAVSSCVPIGVTGGQLQDVVVQWQRDHPTDRNKTAAANVAAALKAAWCPDQ